MLAVVLELPGSHTPSGLEKGKLLCVSEGSLRWFPSVKKMRRCDSGLQPYSDYSASRWALLFTVPLENPLELFLRVSGKQEAFMLVQSVENLP